MHVIAAKAIAFGEALEPAFKIYQEQLVNNSKALAVAFQKLGYRVISGGTDNHLFTLDVFKTLNITGLKAEKTLDKVNITCNKNLIPFDQQKPKFGSGIRLGTAAITTRGLKEDAMPQIAKWIDEALKNADNEDILTRIQTEIIDFMSNLPLFEGE
jgi:glycine hydroxymethyltransferase